MRSDAMRHRSPDNGDRNHTGTTFDMFWELPYVVMEENQDTKTAASKTLSTNIQRRRGGTDDAHSIEASGSLLDIFFPPSRDEAADGRKKYNRRSARSDDEDERDEGQEGMDNVSGTGSRKKRSPFWPIFREKAHSFDGQDSNAASFWDLPYEKTEKESGHQGRFLFGHRSKTSSEDDHSTTQSGILTRDREKRHRFSDLLCHNNKAQRIDDNVDQTSALDFHEQPYEHYRDDIPHRRYRDDTPYQYRDEYDDESVAAYSYIRDDKRTGPPVQQHGLGGIRYHEASRSTRTGPPIWRRTSPTESDYDESIASRIFRRTRSSEKRYK